MNKSANEIISQYCPVNKSKMRKRHAQVTLDGVLEHEPYSDAATEAIEKLIRRYPTLQKDYESQIHTHIFS